MSPAVEEARLSDKRLSTLFIVPSLRRAGAENQLVDLMNGLSPQLFEKHLLTYRPDTSLLENVDERGITVHIEERRSRLDWHLVHRIAQIIDRHSIEVVHCTLQNALLYGFAAMLRARRARPKIVAAIHTTTNVDWKFELSDRLLYQFLLRRVDEVWFVCEAQRRHWQRKFGFLAGKSVVIYNGVNTDAFAPVSPSAPRKAATPGLHVPGNGILVSCIAGFRPEKGHDILIRAFASIADEVPLAHLVLAGDGPTRTRSEALARQLGLERRIHFPGQVADVSGIVKGSICTVLASTAVETFSIAMLESMAMAVPVVATDIGGAAEAIDSGRNGYLVEPGDSGALAHALRRLISDTEHANWLGRNARQTVVERFGVDRMAQAASGRLLEVADRAPKSASPKAKSA